MLLLYTGMINGKECDAMIQADLVLLAVTCTLLEKQLTNAASRGESDAEVDADANCDLNETKGKRHFRQSEACKPRHYQHYGSTTLRMNLLVKTGSYTGYQGRLKDTCKFF